MIFRFESLQERFLPAILEIENATHAIPWSELAFRNELDHAHGIFRVALVEGEVGGYGCVWLAVDEAHVTTIAVREDLRRQGVGKKLMVELLARSLERGATCSTLEVRAGNSAAIALYEKLGYVRAALRKGYYPDNREDAVVMWLYDLISWDPKS